MRKLALLALLGFMSIPVRAQQLSPEAKWATQTGVEYQIHPDIVYKKANQFECKLERRLGGR